MKLNEPYLSPCVVIQYPVADFSAFDSEVMQLIDDLNLVQIGTPEFREWIALWTVSHYTRFWFCERWQREMDERRRRKVQQQRELYKRNKPYSRYVHESIAYQSEICWPD